MKSVFEISLSKIFHYDHQIRSDQISRSVVSDSLRPHESQHARPPCPSLFPWVCSNLCPLSQWCHPTISFSVIPFSSCPQPFPTLGSFPMNWLFTSGGQSIGAAASASVLPMNLQGCFSLGLTGLSSLLSKGLARVFSSTTVQGIHSLALPGLSCGMCISFFSCTMRDLVSWPGMELGPLALGTQSLNHWTPRVVQKPSFFWNNMSA